MALKKRQAALTEFLDNQKLNIRLRGRSVPNPSLSLPKDFVTAAYTDGVHNPSQFRCPEERQRMNTNSTPTTVMLVVSMIATIAVGIGTAG